MLSVFTLGKDPFALGKGFAECSTRQSPLGKFFLGKGSLPSAFYRGTRQNKKQFLPSAWGGTRQNIFGRSTLTVNGCFAEGLTQHSAKKKLFFLKITLPSAPAQALGKGFLNFFKKSTLPSAPVQTLGKVFFIFF